MCNVLEIQLEDLKQRLIITKVTVDALRETVELLNEHLNQHSTFEKEAQLHEQEE